MNLHFSERVLLDSEAHQPIPIDRIRANRVRRPVQCPKAKKKQLKMTTTETAKDVKDLKDIKEKIDLGLLEEDDEFEEFQAEGMVCGRALWPRKSLESWSGSATSEFARKTLRYLTAIFPIHEADWQEKDCDEDLSIWEDNWDDDDVEDDFSKQLKSVFHRSKTIKTAQLIELFPLFLSPTISPTYQTRVG